MDDSGGDGGRTKKYCRPGPPRRPSGAGPGPGPGILHEGVEGRLGPASRSGGAAVAPHQVVEDGARGVDVRRRADRCPGPDLGARKPAGTQSGTGPGGSPTRRAAAKSPILGRSSGPIDDGPGVQGAVDEAVIVDVLEAEDESPAHFGRPVRRQRAAERPALGVFQHQVRLAELLAVVEKPEDVRVIEPGQGPGLPAEGGVGRRRGGQLEPHRCARWPRAGPDR